MAREVWRVNGIDGGPISVSSVVYAFGSNPPHRPALRIRAPYRLLLSLIPLHAEVPEVCFSAQQPLDSLGQFIG